MSASLTLIDSTPIHTITFPSFAGQPVDAPTIGVNGAGWVAKIVLTGITDVTHTCDPTKLTLVVSDPGYTTTGGTTTVSRTITGNAVLKRIYYDPLVGQSQGSNPNNNVDFQINVVGSDLEIYVVLSDWVYSGTTITSATLASGFYTGAPTGTISSPVNSCDLAYPTPVFAWYSPHYMSTEGTNSLHVEGLAFHRHAMNGQQVACVQYQATDAHSISGATLTVSSTQLTTMTAMGFPPEVWAGSVDFSTLTQGDACTINAIVYPWIGNNPYNVSTDGVAWPTQRGQTLLHAFCDRTGVYGGAYSYVDANNGNDTSGVVSKTAATAKATPFQTMVGAAAGIKTFNNANSSHNDVGGGHIRLMDNAGADQTHNIGGMVNSPGQTWLFIEPDPANTGHILLDSGNIGQPGLTWVRGVKFVPTTYPYVWFGNSSGTDKTVLQNVTVDNTGAKQVFGFWNFMWVYGFTTVGTVDPILFGSFTPVGPFYMPVLSGYVNTLSTSIQQVGSLVGCYLPTCTSAAFGKVPNSAGFGEFDGNVVYNNRASLEYDLNASTWSANSGYFFGQILNSGVDKYYWLTSTGNGTSGASEPTWTAGTVTDGTCTWGYIGDSASLSFSVGFAFVQNLCETSQDGSGNGSYLIFNDGDMSFVDNIIDMHNTAVGGKVNGPYNDGAWDHTPPSCNIKQGVRKYSILDNQNLKNDGSVHASGLEGGCGNYPFSYGVGNYGTICLYGDVQRNWATVPVNSADASNGGFIGLGVHPTGIANLQGVVSQNLRGTSAPTAQDGWAMMKIMQMFSNYTVGPWGNSGPFPAWAGSTVYAAHSTVRNGGHSYYSAAGGTSGGTAPTHTTGDASDGGTTWTFEHADYAPGGDYTPVRGTALTSIVPSGGGVLKYDMAGNLRFNDGTGAAGALEAPAPTQISLSTDTPQTIPVNATGFAVKVVGTGSSWNSATPSWSISAGSITAHTVQDDTHATLTISAPSSAQTLTITDATTGGTVKISVQDVAYDLTIDPTPFVVFDHRSNFWKNTGGTIPATTAGDTVARIDSAAINGTVYSAIADEGTVTLGVDGNGHKYLIFPGSASFKIASSSGFDANFTNAGPYGGNGIFACFSTSAAQEAFICAKNATSNTTTAQLAIWDGGSSGYVQRFGGVESFRPYTGGWASGCVVNESATGTVNGATNYRDGTSVYYNGVKANGIILLGSQLDLTDTVGQDLYIGRWEFLTGIYTFTGNLYSLVLWSRAPRHHEVLATDRYYRGVFGGPETLTNQPFGLVVEGNSEFTVPISGTEIGIADRTSAGLGISTNACFNIAGPGRQGAQIVHDFNEWTLPLIKYVQSLGVTVADFLWEMVNDNYGSTGADSYVNYFTALSGATTGVKFSAQTAMASSSNTTSSGASGTNAICAGNQQALTDAGTNGYPIGRLGTDPNSPVSNYTVGDFSDGLHWKSPAIAESVPYFVGIINKSLGLTGLAVSPTTVNASSTGNTLTLTGTGTDWYINSGTSYPTFTVDGGSIAGQSVTNGTAGSITFTAPTSGTVHITDPTTTETVALTVDVTPQVATPTFSPTAGTYTSPQTVTISSSTSGATIRYTVDGSTPSESVGTIYSGAVTVGATTTIKAIAYKAGDTDSSIASAAFTINLPQCAAPTFSPVAGTYTGQQTVTVSSSTGGATIRYTTDGSTPSESNGNVYSGPITVASTGTVKAIAYEVNYIDSSVASASYTINVSLTYRTLAIASDEASAIAAQSRSIGQSTLQVDDGTVFGSPSSSGPIYLTVVRNSALVGKLSCTGRSGNILTINATDGSDFAINVGDTVANFMASDYANDLKHNVDALVNDYVSQTGTYSDPSWITSLNPNKVQTQNGPTSSRPTTSIVGFMFYDTTLKQPVFWDGSAWRDASGTAV